MKKKIDYDIWSKDELIKEIKRIKETTYGLVWHRDLPEEKIDILINPDARTPSEMFPNEMAGKPFPVLKEVKAKAIETDKDKPTNILIEGDNYHSLAVLNFTHEEAIDLIYIDPPYNTGNDDFIYTDKIKSEYVKSDDPFRHSKWIAFMEKRLKLAKNLLKPTGAIFISIDDHEQAPLKLLCDEIFGVDNFINCLVWKANPRGRAMDRFFATTKEYILVYAKDSENIKISLNNIDDVVKLGKYKEKDDISFYKKGYPLHNGTRDFHLNNRPNLGYSIYYNPSSQKALTKDEKISKNGEFIIDEKFLDKELKEKGYIRIIPKINSQTKRRRVWRWGQEKFNREYKDELLFTEESDGWYIYQKDRLTIDGEKFEKYKDVIDDIRTDEGGLELQEMFGEKTFSFPKPIRLIEQLINFIDLEQNATILDFFAGSGTTGHAVLSLNDIGKNYKFILCTNNGDEKSKHKIASDVCYPRLVKAIRGYSNRDNEKIEGLGGNLKYYTCAFIEAKESDRNKRKLVNESTEMLCIKESAFELVQEQDDFKIFRNHDKYLGIIFHEDSISDYKTAIKKIKGYFHTYTFSMTDDPHKEEFTDVADKVILCAIPDVILKVYREIFKE